MNGIEGDGPTRSSTPVSMPDRLLNHLAMPPQLPQQQDPDLPAVEGALLQRLVAAAKTMRDLPNNTSTSVWASVARSLNAVDKLSICGRLERSVLLLELRHVATLDFLVLHIRAQNAAVFIYPSDSRDSVIFEIFEASPKSESVLAAEDALTWDFPGAAIAMPLARYQDASFLDSLASFIETSSHGKPTEEFAPLALKAGAQTVEARDTPDPSIISSMLAAILEANGQRIATPILRKKVHDDVCWKSNLPWRRLPLWLIMRVCVRRILGLRLGDGLGRTEYKFFVALILKDLLADVGRVASFERSSHLKAKIARRLVKLDTDFRNAQSAESTRFQYFFTCLDPLFDRTVKTVSQHIEKSWEDFKSRATKTIPELPRRACDADVHFDLRISGQYLRGAMDTWKMASRGRLRPRQVIPHNKDIPLSDFPKPYFTLAKLENEARIFCSSRDLVVDQSILESRCHVLSRMVPNYMNKVENYYDDNIEERSIMILTVLELWVHLDMVACSRFPLLKEFHPVFVPKSLDVLYLSRLADMQRLQRIQTYLQTRVDDAEDITIFDDLQKDCFAARYFDESPDASHFQSTLEEIQTSATEARNRKEEEWSRKSWDFDTSMRRINETTCLLTDESWTDGSGRSIQPVHHPDCPRCQLRSKVERMRVKVHEDPLPGDEVMQKVVVFELGAFPGAAAFQAYRDTTWEIITKLAPAFKDDSKGPRCTISTYKELASFVYSSSPNVVLASSTKSFLSTHYSSSTFPVALDDILKPNGLKYGYWDQSMKVWPSRSRMLRRPFFTHHCMLPLPKNSPFASIAQAFPSDMPGPSSYDIVASQNSCPAGVNVHEYLAFQTLLSGNARRWVCLLSELGSSNLNFSSESTLILVRHLALQAGPTDESGDILRLTHLIVREQLFGEKIIQQLAQRLSSLSANWREVHLMNIIIDLCLRIFELTENSVHPAHFQALGLLGIARETTLGWMKLLREETRQQRDVDTARRCQIYTLYAAILCKRTFTIHREQSMALDYKSLPTFVECCITLQHNLLGNVKSLPQLLREAVIQDFRLTFELQKLVKRSIQESPATFISALAPFWPAATASTVVLVINDDNTNSWVSVDVSIPTTNDGAISEQRVDYECLHGLLLLDRIPVGKLPPEHQRDPSLTTLLGDQSFLTLPSSLPGMTYILNITPDDHEIHIAPRQGGLLIRVRKGGKLWELVPKGIFGTLEFFDLPCPLIEDHVHWLDLSTGIVDIRPAAQPWLSRKTNWRLNTRDGKCTRSIPYSQRARLRIKQKRGFCPPSHIHHLVAPHVPLFHRIGRIFEGLERRQKLLLYQPEESALYVELKAVQLKFYINNNKRLHCMQLDQEIDTNQAIGTWNGLHSKLVFRSVHTSRRTVLVPLGALKVERDGPHVSIKADYDVSVGKFVVNEILGRIDCAAEPTLILKKAELHAYTSFVIPDKLTGRTGTEEAKSILTSGIASPWLPLGPGQFRVLKSIAQLTPKREHYPDENRKVMKSESWDHNLTAVIQDDDYRRLATNILVKSQRLRRFHVTASATGASSSTGAANGVVSNAESHDFDALQKVLKSDNAHLNFKAAIRRQRYNRHLPLVLPTMQPKEYRYTSRDRTTHTNMAYANVLEIVSLVRSWPSRIRTEKNLATSLAQSSVIKGFDDVFSKVLLTERIGVDVAQEWGPLVKFAQDHVGEGDRCELMFLLAAAAFRFNARMELIRTILGFAVFDELRSMDTPTGSAVFSRFQPGQVPTKDSLLAVVLPFASPFPRDPDAEALEKYLGAKDRRKLREAEAKHVKAAREDCERAVEILMSQWPCEAPTFEGLLEALKVDLGAVLTAVRPEWARMFHNLELSAHLQNVHDALQARQTDSTFSPPSLPLEGQLWAVRMTSQELPQLTENLMGRPLRFLEPAPWPRTREEVWDIRQSRELPPQALEFSLSLSQPETKVPATLDELESIVKQSMDPQSAVSQKYGEDLLRSLDMFRQKQEKNSVPSFRVTPMPRELASLTEEVNLTFREIESSLEHPDVDMSALRIKWLRNGLLWPIVTPVTVLQQIGSTTSCNFGSDMKSAVVRLGLAITALQHGKRLSMIAKNNGFQNRFDAVRYKEEQENRGHVNWSPMEFPDWLLLEIESNILLRPDQITVAREIISPKSGSNSVCQLQMGKGKTSAIIPMAAAVLSGCSLARVIVPKALLQQTAQLLQSRLGGLLNRQVAHVPFSRRTPTDEANIKAFAALHRDIMRSAGVMICLPEHLLSFTLSGLQRVLDHRVPEADLMIRTQSWLKSVCRDVLDESDHILAVRTQLIYPSGHQLSLDGHPHRWQVAEKLLQLVALQLPSLGADYPHSIEVVDRPGGGFPLVYFLRKDVEDELMRRLTIDICKGNGGILPVSALDSKARMHIKRFISAVKVSEVTVSFVKTMCPDRVHLRQIVYLLRGLLMNRILMMCLKKKWNVQYGLHPQRDPIAVPFYAKGVPSEQSEWGHPDVSVIFTCLAFYYGGVSQSQLAQALEHVLKSDDPSSEYDRWTQSTVNFPDSLREWSSINIDDAVQLESIWTAVRYNVVVIDYFLNNFVFPQHAKQFRVKLQSNGWDLPLFTTTMDAPHRKAVQGIPRTLTTGFSGTNDNRTMLPLNIKQHDLDALSHTNAEVLTYLLSPRNRRYQVIADEQGRRLSEEDFLHKLTCMNIRIFIDAGAQVLEMNNEAVAKRWLQMNHTALGALYFDEANKPWIITKIGTKTPLLASAYADDLSQCLIYLDEAHTRGTDLKLPPMARGALTLSLGQTKDHTVQAAMRLRQLGETQSIVWFAPPEVHSRILHVQGKRAGAVLDSSDVVSWLLTNSVDGLEQLQPLYYSQGMDFCKRVQAAVDNPKFLQEKSHRERYVACIRQDESQTLKDLYEPKAKGKLTGLKKATEPSIKSFVAELNTQRMSFRDTGNAVQAAALQEVEQEREVAFEVESVRQVKKPVHFSALKFPGQLHRDLETFARTGRLTADSASYRPALQYMANTSIARKSGVSRSLSKSRLLVSPEFQRSVKLQIGTPNEDLLRPVHWLLWSELSDTCIIVIPEEAELLMPLVRDPESPTYLLTYMACITRKMLHFNRLDYYSIPQLPPYWYAPQWLKIELGIFAGRLYFEWDEYHDLCEFLGLDGSSPVVDDYDESSSEDDDAVDQVDGVDDSTAATTNCTYDTPNGDAADAEEAKQIMSATTLAPVKFAKKPLTLLQDWLALRRRGQDFIHTPMGHVTQGKPLHEDHAFFRRTELDDAARVGKPAAPISKRARPATDTHSDDGLQDIEDVMEEHAGDAFNDSASSDDEIEYDEDEMYSPHEDAASREASSGEEVVPPVRKGMPEHVRRKLREREWRGRRG